MGFKSFQDEFGETPEEKKKTTINAFLPLFGLVLIIAFGAIAYVLSEPLTTLLRENVDGIPAEQEVQYVVGGVIFLVMLMLSGMMYAMFAPKPQLRVTEAELKKERMLDAREKKARQLRKQQMNRKAAEEVRKRSGK